MNVPYARGMPAMSDPRVDAAAQATPPVGKPGAVRPAQALAESKAAGSNLLFLREE